MKRPETGSMVFNGDCPGVFINGDDALMFAEALIAVLEDGGSGAKRECVEHLTDLLYSSIDGTGELQIMKPFPDCLMGESNEI